MANEEHVKILMQGVEAWNVWRKENSGVQPDLTKADLMNAYLARADFRGTDFSETKLRRAQLEEALLTKVNFTAADLREANLNGANLRGASLLEANLHEADLMGADLGQTYLKGARLTRTDLWRTIFEGAVFLDTDLSEASAWETVFGDVDLRQVKGLNLVEHRGPSYVDLHTLVRSRGQVSEAFLRGVGASDEAIAYARAFFQQPIQYYNCFISYSNKDRNFATRLYADLQAKGVRCWFASKDLKIGDHYHQRIDESIRLYDKLILILSEQAIQNAWVEREVVAACEKEDRDQRPVLFPIRLDDAVMDTTKAWAADVRRRWHIGDFTRWRHHDTYQQAFERLLRDLKAETPMLKE
jgi:hypothetical protein